MENINEDEISLKEIFHKIGVWIGYLSTQWFKIAVVTFVGAVLGFTYAKMKRPIYTATLTFALEEKSSGGASGISSLASSFGFNIGGSDGGAFAGDNLMELMKSRLLVEKSLLSKVNINGKEETLFNQYVTFNKLNESWANNPDLLNRKFDNENRLNFTRAQDSVLGVVYNHIINENFEVSKKDKKLSIISVKARSEDEIFSKLFCENLVKNVIDFYIETKVGKSRKNVKILENRVDSVKRELDQAMYGRASFADQNMGLIRQSAAVPKLKQEMRVQMLGTMYGELVKNLELTKLALMREEPLIQVIDNPILPLQVDRVGTIRSLIIGGLLSSIIFMLALIIKKIISDFSKS